MKDRFEGIKNRPRLIKALAEQRLVECQENVAAALAKRGTLVEVAAGDVLIEQTASTSDVFFIISGRCNVLVNKRHVATRGPRDAVGEMVVIDPSAPRSATIEAAEPVLVLAVSGSAFEAVANRYPAVWRAAAKIVSERLREREKFHRHPRPVPVAFIGSSSESIEIASAVQETLKEPTEAILWTMGVFNPSGITIEVLLNQAEQADFAVFVFGPDDKIISRRKQQEAPRDNVIFELGLFMGALGRDRTYVIHQSGIDLKIPSDLLGLTRVTYGATTNLKRSVQKACGDIVRQVKKLGPR